MVAVSTKLGAMRYPEWPVNSPTLPQSTWSTLVRTLSDRDREVNNFLNNNLSSSTPDYVPYLDDIHSDPLTALKILSSASSGFVFKGKPGTTYTVSGGGVSAFDSIVSVYNSPVVWVDMQGARFLVNDDCRQFLSIEAAMDCSASVSSVSQTTVNYNGGTGSNNQVSRLALDTSVSVSRNDMFKIYSQDLIEGPALTDLEKKGEVFVAGSVESSGGKTILYSYGVLIETYTSVIKLARYTNKYGSYQIKNIGFAMTSAPTVSAWNPNAIRFINTVGARVEGIGGSDLYSGLLQTLGCVFTKVNNSHAINLTTDLSAEQYGYAWVDYSGYANQGQFLSSQNARNVFTTGTQGASAAEPRPHYYGRTFFTKIYNSQGFNNQSRSFSTHPDAFGCEFIDCRSYQGFTGPSGGSHGFQLRGRRNRIVDCYSYGANGFIVVADASVSGNTQENYLINCTHECPADVSMNSNSASFEFNGYPALPAVGNYMENCTAIIHRGEGAVVRAGNANVEINGLKTIFKPTTAFQGQVINVSGSCVVRGTNFFTDYRGATGGSLRPVILGTGGGQVEVTNWDIQAGTPFNAVVNANNKAGWSVDLTLNIDVSLSNPIAYINTTVSSTYWIDYKINRGRNGIRGFYPASYSTSTNVSVNLEYRSSPTVFYNVSASAPVNIIGISQGYAQGQQMYIYNDVLSPSNVSVEATTGGLIAVGGNIEITPGDTLVLTYDGARWL